MDYGPFGFIDRYDPLFAKWTGSGEHYGFLNQPQALGVERRARAFYVCQGGAVYSDCNAQAAMANYHTLVTSVAVLLKESLGFCYRRNPIRTGPS